MITQLIPQGERDGVDDHRRVPDVVDGRGLGTVVAIGLGSAVLMTFAIEGFTPLALVTASALALGWGVLYGGLVGAVSRSRSRRRVRRELR